jgi:hypothetical protein
LAAILAAVTAFAWIAAVLTLFLGAVAWTAATPVPPSATSNASEARTVAGDGRRRRMLLTAVLLFSDEPGRAWQSSCRS